MKNYMPKLSRVANIDLAPDPNFDYGENRPHNNVQRVLTTLFLLVPVVVFSFAARIVVEATRHNFLAPVVLLIFSLYSLFLYVL